MKALHESLMDELESIRTEDLAPREPRIRALTPDVAIIMDATDAGRKRRFCHEWPVIARESPPVRSTVETCAQLGPSALTLYAFSVGKLEAPANEVDTLWRLLRRYLISELEVMHRHDIRFTGIGRLHELPEFVQRELESVIRDTRASRTATQPPINYGGRAELVDAIAALVKDARERTW